MFGRGGFSRAVASSGWKGREGNVYGPVRIDPGIDVGVELLVDFRWHDGHGFGECLPAIARHRDPNVGLVAASAEDGPHRIDVVGVRIAAEVVHGDPLFVFELEAEGTLVR